MPANPAWVASYQQRAASGCECTEQGCFESTKRSLDATLEEHGGFDEVPPDVHNAHGEFEKCFQTGTLDLGRDLNIAADKLCLCEDFDCAAEYRVMVSDLNSKYEAVATRELFGMESLITRAKGRDEPTSGAASRLEKCIGSASISAQDFLQRNRLRVDAVCQCTDPECVDALGHDAKEPAPVPAKVLVQDQDSIKDEIAELAERNCECMGRLVAGGIAKEVLGDNVSVTVTGSVKCGP